MSDNEMEIIARVSAPIIKVKIQKRDLIEKLSEVTICNANFDVIYFAKCDVEKLREIADLIERELKLLEAAK